MTSCPKTPLLPYQTPGGHQGTKHKDAFREDLSVMVVCRLKTTPGQATPEKRTARTSLQVRLTEEGCRTKVTTAQIERANARQHASLVADPAHSHAWPASRRAMLPPMLLPPPAPPGLFWFLFFSFLAHRRPHALHSVLGPLGPLRHSGESRVPEVNVRETAAYES